MNPECQTAQPAPNNLARVAYIARTVSDAAAILHHIRSTVPPEDVAHVAQLVAAKLVADYLADMVQS